MLAQPPPDRPRLLGAQIEGQVLLLRVEEAQLLSLVGVDDGEDAGDGFAEVVTTLHRGLDLLCRVPKVNAEEMTKEYAHPVEFR